MAKYIKIKALLLLLLHIGIVYNSIAQTDSLSIKTSTEVVTKNDTLNQKTDKTTKEQLDAPKISDVISGPKIFWTIVLLIVGYLAIKLFLTLFIAYGKRNPKYNLFIKRFLPIFKILAWTFLIYIIIVGVYSPPAATLLAFLASIGVALGFAAQDLVKNLFGGLVVMFDSPFQLGDKIESGGNYGEVIAISIRATKIVTADDSIITIPNSGFMNSFVSNSNSGENNCQVVAEIYLPIAIDTEKVRKIAVEAAQISKYIYLNKPISVLFFNEMHMTKSVYKMRLKAYVSDLSKEFAFKSEMTEIVIKTLIEEKILSSDTLIK
jgi:small-conductance mechanosensitive channel